MPCDGPPRRWLGAAEGPGSPAPAAPSAGASGRCLCGGRRGFSRRSARSSIGDGSSPVMGSSASFSSMTMRRRDGACMLGKPLGRSGAGGSAALFPRIFSSMRACFEKSGIRNAGGSGCASRPGPTRADFEPIGGSDVAAGSAWWRAESAVAAAGWCRVERSSEGIAPNLRSSTIAAADCCAMLRPPTKPMSFMGAACRTMSDDGLSNNNTAIRPLQDLHNLRTNYS